MGAVRFRGAGDDHEVLARGTALFDGHAVLEPKTQHRIKRSRRLAMKTTTMVVVAVVAALAMVVPTGWAQTPDDKEHAELAKALKEAKVPLERGLTASTKEGKPISAKYEVEDGKLQLSVYTMKGDAFSEVIVDHKTGRIAKTEAITQGDDLSHAKAQSEAMAKAKRSLVAAASGAIAENKGYRVVSVMPAMKDGHPVAEVTLVKGAEWKTVSEKLD
jgi:hypothetical protein